MGRWLSLARRHVDCLAVCDVTKPRAVGSVSFLVDGENSRPALGVVDDARYTIHKTN